MDSNKKKATERLRGRVARILTSREIAINLGEDNGVEVGMYFDILHEGGQDIEDPETGEVLGNIERPKVRVKVTHVQDKLSLASTYKKRRVNLGGSLEIAPFGLSRALMPPRWVTKFETLKTEEKTWENLDEEGSYVKIGDPVVEAFAASDEDGIEQREQVEEVGRSG